MNRKRKSVLALEIIASLLIFAYYGGNKSDDEVNANSVKSKSTMNFKQIKKGNYTSLLGKWKLVALAYNSYDGNGINWHSSNQKQFFQLRVTKKKIRQGKFSTFYGKTLKIKGEFGQKRKVKFKKRRGCLTAVSDGAILYEYDFYPKNVPLQTKVSKTLPERIDNKKDRIVIFSSNLGGIEVYQRGN